MTFDSEWDDDGWEPAPAFDWLCYAIIGLIIAAIIKSI